MSGEWVSGCGEKVHGSLFLVLGSGGEPGAEGAGGAEGAEGIEGSE